MSHGAYLMNLGRVPYERGVGAAALARGRGRAARRARDRDLPRASADDHARPAHRGGRAARARRRRGRRRRDRPRRAVDLPRAGQLVCYPILDLKLHGKDVKRYCRDLEEAIIRTVAAFGVEATRIDGLTGVWVEGGGEPRKIASIGVHLSRWISTHGYALNVDLDPAPFTEWITACGLEDASFTSLAAELGRPVTLDEVRPAARDALAEVFELRVRRAARRRARPLGAAAARPARRRADPSQAARSGRRAQAVEHDREVAAPRVRIGRLPRRLDRGADEQRHVLGADVRAHRPARLRARDQLLARARAARPSTRPRPARRSRARPTARGRPRTSRPHATRSRGTPRPRRAARAPSAACTTSASTRLQTTAAISESLVGKRRKTVACPTPARRAISSTLTSGPRSANASAAASSTRSRFR